MSKNFRFSFQLLLDNSLRLNWNQGFVYLHDHLIWNYVVLCFLNMKWIFFNKFKIKKILTQSNNIEQHFPNSYILNVHVPTNQDTIFISARETGTQYDTNRSESAPAIMTQRDRRREWWGMEDAEWRHKSYTAIVQLFSMALNKYFNLCATEKRGKNVFLSFSFRLDAARLFALSSCNIPTAIASEKLLNTIYQFITPLSYRLDAVFVGSEIKFAAFSMRSKSRIWHELIRTFNIKGFVSKAPA